MLENNEFIFPNFNKSILNISSTLATYLGCNNDKPILNELIDYSNPYVPNEIKNQSYSVKDNIEKYI